MKKNFVRVITLFITTCVLVVAMCMIGLLDYHVLSKWQMYAGLLFLVCVHVMHHNVYDVYDKKAKSRAEDPEEQGTGIKKSDVVTFVFTLVILYIVYFTLCAIGKVDIATIGSVQLHVGFIVISLMNFAYDKFDR